MGLTPRSLDGLWIGKSDAKDRKVLFAETFAIARLSPQERIEGGPLDVAHWLAGLSDAALVERRQRDAA